MNTRLSIVTSVGVFSAVLVGLMPACGSDSNGGGGGKLLGDGGPSTGGAANSATGGTPGTGTGATGVGGGTAGSGTGTSTSPIGQTCTKDTDCGTMGLKCLLPSGNDLLGGGVPNGICTLDCSADINAVSPSAISACAKVDPSATCLQVSPTQGYCWELCTIGPVPSSEVKCHGRRDMGCYDPDMVGTGYCKPTCRGDFDCRLADGTMRKCDLSEGNCVDSIPTDRNLPLGSKCDPRLTNDPCSGRCIGVSSSDSGALSDVGFCSGLCKIGEIACGVDPNSKANIGADCLFAPNMSADIGDLGFCAQLCDCNDDCANPDFICSSLPSQLVSQVGRKGACNPKEGANASEPNGIKCTGTTKPPAGTGGAGGAGTKPPAEADAGPDAK